MTAVETFKIQKLKLLNAQDNALKLIEVANARCLFEKAKSEKELNSALYQLADEVLGIKKFWHKRIVRAGENTLFPYRENPPNLVIEIDDILFIDFGPILENWEADIGRTIVLGKDLAKIKLRDSSETLFFVARDYFKMHYDSITASELYCFIRDRSKDLGYSLGGWHCGHLIGEFPHEELKGDDTSMYLHPDNPKLIMCNLSDGSIPHWILEIHLINEHINRGAFFEQLLTDVL